MLRRLACLALLLPLGACIVPDVSSGPEPDAPVRLWPSADVMQGVALENVLIETDETIVDGPLHTSTIKGVAKRTKPAVVSLYTLSSVPARVRGVPFLRVNATGFGLGSGFFIHPGGLVLTNEHVVRGATDIRAMTHGGVKYRARIVATDAAMDLALLMIVDPDRDFPVLACGDSDVVRVGDGVLAIGNPLGLGHTVTMGIISQTGRDLFGAPPEGGRRPLFLQTDAAINPGNSGGPLVTLTGAWIGVNTAVPVQAQGIGFTVPSNQAREFLQSVVAGEGKWTGRRR